MEKGDKEKVKREIGNNEEGVEGEWMQGNCQVEDSEEGK